MVELLVRDRMVGICLLVGRERAITGCADLHDHGKEEQRCPEPVEGAERSGHNGSSSRRQLSPPGSWRTVPRSLRPGPKPALRCVGSLRVADQPARRALDRRRRAAVHRRHAQGDSSRRLSRGRGGSPQPRLARRPPVAGLRTGALPRRAPPHALDPAHRSGRRHTGRRARRRRAGAQQARARHRRVPPPRRRPADRVARSSGRPAPRAVHGRLRHPGQRDVRRLAVVHLGDTRPRARRCARPGRRRLRGARRLAAGTRTCEAPAGARRAARARRTGA